MFVGMFLVSSPPSPSGAPISSNACADAINASGKSHTYDVDAALLADIQGSLGDVYELVKQKSGIADLVEAYYNAL